MAKTVYQPNEIAKSIRKELETNGQKSYAELVAVVGKFGTATIKALVDNGYVEIAEVRDVICSCCGHKKKDVKFYKATDKAI